MEYWTAFDTEQLTPVETQVLVIGSGAAGLTTALDCARAGKQVLVVVRDTLEDCNTAKAQGGIAAVMGEGDSTALHLEDTLIAGAGLTDEAMAKILVEEGPASVRDLIQDGALFDRTADGTLALGREGCHSRNRIVHANGDSTGAEVARALRAAAAKEPNITVLEHCYVADLLVKEGTCYGAIALYQGGPLYLRAAATVLATGGVGQVFLHSTNAPGCVGAGISMAFRAGVELANLEFMQFHPTALYEERSYRRPLITEAMRGEGARLLDDRGEAFMLRHDKRGDLAPRDVVAQAMVEEMLRRGVPCLYLDVSGVKQDLPTRFPTVFNQCLEIGIDIRKEPIPVVPAAHYFCGGILTDTFGRTSMPGLYAIGECACTGLHGANRLASTSLLEAAVWGQSCGQHLARITASGREAIPRALAAAIPDWRHEGNEHHDDPALVAQDWANIRNTMWNYVGISRSKARLRRAFEDMRDLVRHIHDFYKGTRISKPLVDLFHGSQTAYVITQAAMRNKNSIGCHHRVD